MSFLTQAVVDKDGVKEAVIYNLFANNVMIELALFIGTLQLDIKYDTGFRRSWARLGWIFFLIGAYLYFQRP